MASLKRTVDLDVPAADLWRALTDESLLADWFASEVELDPRPGGELRCRTEHGEVRAGRVERVEDEELLEFVWERSGQGQSRVLLEVEVLERGSRLTVVETGLDASSAAGAEAGWRQRLEALKTAFARLAYA